VELPPSPWSRSWEFIAESGAEDVPRESWKVQIFGEVLLCEALLDRYSRLFVARRRRDYLPEAPFVTRSAGWELSADAVEELDEYESLVLRSSLLDTDSVLLQTTNMDLVLYESPDQRLALAEPRAYTDDQREVMLAFCRICAFQMTLERHYPWMMILSHGRVLERTRPFEWVIARGRELIDLPPIEDGELPEWPEI